MLIHKHIWKKDYCNKEKMPHHTLAGKNKNPHSDLKQ